MQFIARPHACALMNEHANWPRAQLTTSSRRPQIDFRPHGRKLASRNRSAAYKCAGSVRRIQWRVLWPDESNK